MQDRGQLETTDKVSKYYFEREKCRNCPHRAECIGKRSTVGKILQISINTPGYYEYSQREKLPEFKEKYKKRALIESKNAEMKCFHGLARAIGYGLRSVSLQAKFTAIVVNSKRIAKLLSLENIGIFVNPTRIAIRFLISVIFEQEILPKAV